MATLKEYFDTDFSDVLCMRRSLKIEAIEPKDISWPEIEYQVHFDFESCTKYISFYIPNCHDMLFACKGALDSIGKCLTAHGGGDIKLPRASKALGQQLQIGRDNDDIVVIIHRYPGEVEQNAADLRFSGRVFFYLEGSLNSDQDRILKKYAKLNNQINCL